METVPGVRETALCPPGDLNPHSRSHWNLNPARLPIPPGGQIRLEWNERESNPSLKSSFWRFFSPSTAKAPHVPVYRIFKVRGEAFLNHPLTIAPFAPEVKGWKPPREGGNPVVVSGSTQENPRTGDPPAVKPTEHPTTL